MKRKISLAVVLVLVAATLTGCGIVTVVPIGEESAYTGETEFNSGAESSNDWEQIVEEISAEATDLTELLNEDEIGSAAVAVSGTATIIEFNTDTPKYYLLIEPDGYSGEDEVRVQAGGVYSGTAVRDVQTLRDFEDFTNQTEWSEYAKSLNTEVDEQVVEPLALDESVNGKTLTITGAATASGDTVTITPVAMSIE